MNMRKEERGITLIALVVTIIVLLILAGIAISLTVGNNGLFARAKNAANTWKEAEANEADEMSNFEKIYDETLGNLGLDGNKVKINISKYPATEKAAVVLLKVTSVEGIEIYEEEKLPTMSEEEKKDIIKKINILVVSQQTGRHLTSFEEVMELKGIPSEDDFWNILNQECETLDDAIKGMNGEMKELELKTCFIQNPDGEYSDEYKAKENGTYTFIVEDIFTGNKYKKTVEVSNIDKNKSTQYYVASGNGIVGLVEKGENKETTFESAFIMINGEKIDISSIIIVNGDYSYIKGKDIAAFLSDNKGHNSNFWKERLRSSRVFEIVKDGVSYFNSVTFVFQDS